MSKVLICIIIIFSYTTLVKAQTNDCDKQLDYVNYNQIENEPLILSKVSGKAIEDLASKSSKETYPVIGLCLGIFTEKDHILISKTITDENGQFAFKTIPSGYYRLVSSKNSGLCAVNVPIKITHSPFRIFRNKKLVLHMLVRRIDVCSYGDYK